VVSVTVPFSCFPLKTVVFSVVSLPGSFLCGVLRWYPFLDHVVYVQDHGVLYMSRTTVFSVMLSARSAFLIMSRTAVFSVTVPSVRSAVMSRFPFGYM